MAERIQTTISLAILFVLFYLLYKILSPFLIIIAWAMVLSITFYPLYRVIIRLKAPPWIASLATLIIILALILGSFTYIAGSLLNEITFVYSDLEEKGFETLALIQNHPLFAKVYQKINAYRLFEGFDLREGAVTALKKIGAYIAEHISLIFKNAIVFIMNFIIICLTVFYFLKDGEAIVAFITKFLPFSDAQKKRLEYRVKEMVVAAIYGGVAAGIAQGILGGIGFLVFGIPSPVFWGTAMAFFSFIPVFGSFLIWGSGVIFLILSGNLLKGIGLLLYGVLLISSVDNVIKSWVIGSRTKLHILIIFFSVLGGMMFFGFVGFILGPLITALCLSLLEIYTYEEVEE
ncbi:MAG: AI-2E family transporter [Nitrospirae bacterium]|nr:AI-2E family transporter [Nitrospirota bacterium]